MKTSINKKSITTSDPLVLRALSDHPDFISCESKKAEANGHKFKVGDKCVLFGLVDFPDFNETEVEITAIREDGPNGKAYYIKGGINKFYNWLYEYRLKQK